MPVTVYSIVQQETLLAETNQIIGKINISDDQSYLFYILTGSTHNYLGSLYQYLKEPPNKFDNVILVFPYEAPDFFRCITQLSQLVQNAFQLKFSFIDYGADFGLHNHFTFNNFIDENHPTWYSCTAESRKYKWICANRVLKPHRIRLIDKLLKIKQNDNLITAGNYNINHRFKNLINFQLPIQAPDESSCLQNDFQSTRLVPESFRHAIFNIVTESSFENIGDVFETWSRIMITEKTTKAYRLYQFPIFLAPAGHVKFQRKLGFDVFDDIIDHSYDDCIDPFKRIEMVAKQCEIINSKPLHFWQSQIQKNWTRLEHNNNNCSKARLQVENESISKFSSWYNI